MNKKQIIVELAYLILIFYFFYQGISKIAIWTNFSMWLHRAPLLGPLYVPLTFTIPIAEIILSLCMIFHATRIKALIFAIVSLVCYILWVIVFRTFIHTFLFYPYFDFWKRPTWMEKVLVAIMLTVIGLYTLFLSKKDGFIYKKSTAIVASS